MKTIAVFVSYDFLLVKALGWVVLLCWLLTCQPLGIMFQRCLISPETTEKVLLEKHNQEMSVVVTDWNKCFHKIDNIFFEPHFYNLAIVCLSKHSVVRLDLHGNLKLTMPWTSKTGLWFIHFYLSQSMKQATTSAVLNEQEHFCSIVDFSQTLTCSRINETMRARRLV